MIEVSHLTKRYGDFTAVDHLSFKLNPGEILGFLGPNGAGKSTTMKMLTGFLAPDAGSVSIWGCDVATDPISAQRHIGYLPEGAPAYEEMTPETFLMFVAEARGYRNDEKHERVDRALQQMSLQSVSGQRIETLSKGFKRRVGLAQAILHDPDVLILDEPTDGLDPNQKYQVREMIKGLSKDKIVIVSTHILEEVTAVCSRAMVMAAGSLVFDGTPQELMTRSRFHGATVISLLDVSLDPTGDLLALPDVVSVEGGSGEFTIFPEEPGGHLFQSVAALAQEKGWAVASIHQEQGRLDEVFRRLTEGVAA